MDRYWAAAPKEDIAKEMMAKVLRQKKHLEKSGQLTALRKAYKTFYGNVHIEPIEGSLQAIEVNHFANLVRHIHVMVTGNRPAWEPRAVNTDTKSQADTQLAAGLLDYYMRENGLEAQLIEACEKCLFLKEGWISVGWDVLGGKVYGKDPENGLPIYEGEIEYKVHTLLDVTREIRKKNMKHKWYIVREYQNKWDVAAKYSRGDKESEIYKKIIALKDDEKANVQYELNGMGFEDDDHNDLIPVYELRHEKTAALPQGRMTIIVDTDIPPLFDGPLPYDEAFVFNITSAKQYETAFGHSQSHDILSLNDAFNATVSAILSNQAANAVQNFQVPKGAAPRVTQLMDGMNVWEYDPKAGKMETMDLLKTAPEVFNFADFLGKQQELISGVNQISRGNAPATLSGTAMALIQQQAIQFSSGVALGYNMISENVGTASIKLLKRFAVVPRVAAIAGKSKRTQMRTFKGSDLDGIERVIVDSANPLTKTAAGRVEIANQLLQQQMIKTPHQYISVLTTGNLEPLYEHENSQNLLMRSENEWLMEGKACVAVMTDDDALHVLEHSTILASPEARENPQVLQLALDHIQQHIQQAKTKDPVLAAMLKQQSFAPPPMMPGPMPGAPEGGAPMGPGPEAVMDNQNPITAQAEQAALPSPALPPEMGV